jgi:hypothetical protein
MFGKFQLDKFAIKSNFTEAARPARFFFSPKKSHRRPGRPQQSQRLLPELEDFTSHRRAPERPPKSLSRRTPALAAGD